MPLHDISQELAIYTKLGTWEPTRGYTEADLNDLRVAALNFVLDSPVGKQLLEEGGPEMGTRLLEVFGERYKGKFPSSDPFVENLMQCATDLRSTLRPKAAPSPAARVAPTPVVKSKDEIAAEAEQAAKDKEKHLGKVKQFARLFNQELAALKPISALKPKAGFITVGGYRYPASFLDEALNLNLID